MFMQKYSNFTNISENILNIKRTKCFHFYPEFFFSFLTSVSLFKKKERSIVLLKEIVRFLSEEQPFKGTVDVISSDLKVNLKLYLLSLFKSAIDD